MQDHEQQTTEVRTTHEQQGATHVQRQTVATATPQDGVALAVNIVWYVAGFIITMIALRVVLLLTGANQGNAFVDFIYAIGGFFAAPFYGIFNYVPVYGKSVLEVSSLVAIAIYALAAWGITKLLTLSRDKSHIVE